MKLKADLNGNQLAEDFLHIQRKIVQASNIYTKLEQNKELGLERLRNYQENEGMLKLLRYISDLTEREIRVLYYCRLGLKEAKQVVERSELQNKSYSGFLSKTKYFFKRVGNTIGRELDKIAIKADSMITGMKKEEYTLKDSSPQLISELIGMLYSELVLELDIIKENLEKIGDNFSRQQEYLKKLIKLGEQGMLTGNIGWYDEYKKFEEERLKFWQIINEVKKYSRRGKILLKIENINSIILKNKITLNIQPLMIPPTSSLVSWPTAGFLAVSIGWIMIPVIILAFTAIRWIPTATVVVKEWKNL